MKHKKRRQEIEFVLLQLKLKVEKWPCLNQKKKIKLTVANTEN